VLASVPPRALLIRGPQSNLRCSSRAVVVVVVADDAILFLLFFSLSLNLYPLPPSREPLSRPSFSQGVIYDAYALYLFKREGWAFTFFLLLLLGWRPAIGRIEPSVYSMAYREAMALRENEKIPKWSLTRHLI